jgi:hypothetical protein
MPEIISYGRHEYRTQGGEIHRRPAERQGLAPKDASWLVLNQGEPVPELVRNQLMDRPSGLRFD